MNRRKLLQRMFGLTLVVLLLAGCGRAPAESTATPTYSEVVSTYPEGTEINCTDIMVSRVTPDGKWDVSGGPICSCEGTPFFKCYGAKITISGNSVTIDGTTYPPGTKLTVDKDLQWIEVSSWD
jgi:hypothetical protein